MSKDLKLAVVGTGIFATDMHLPTINKISNLKAVGCYNRTKAKAETFADKAGIAKDKIYDSLEEVFQDESIDFVDTLLPVQYNLDAVKLAVKYNKPMIFEKPIAANLEQAKEIVKISEQSDLPIGVLENWSFLSSIEKIKKDYLPKIGKVVSFTYNSTGPWISDNKYLETTWRQKPQHIGGFLSDGGVHQLALLTGLLGDVESISALTQQLRESSGTDDILFSTMKLKSGAIGTFSYGSAFGAAEKAQSLIIYGLEGSIVYNFSKSLPKPKVTLKTGSANPAEFETTEFELEEVDTMVEEFKNFSDALIKNDKKLVRVPPAVAFHHLAIVAAALESSAKNGDSVKIEQP
ncbi:uncharacterized protein CLIB1444_01S10000 [[Candida] jaroonii]|uniref:Uncharacterized protein n=1 Tax=[Candida] jaroonii TaxID=467808 RepID=A0ACA9Y149_9ASCO|nr:uncharacterized protein CLIB1444_01S10000 [[Candida] jaroonii]